MLLVASGQEIANKSNAQDHLKLKKPVIVILIDNVVLSCIFALLEDLYCEADATKICFQEVVVKSFFPTASPPGLERG